jgi:hypothetical protein
MADIKIRVGQQNSESDIKVRVGQQNGVKIISAIAGAQMMLLSDLLDVNATNLMDGMVLVYNGATNQWDATLSLTPGITQNLDINGGNF